jgi:orotate phosphoribosyltransferase
LQVNETLLIVDDVCAKGTALRKVIISSFEKDNKGYILPFLLVFLNRSGLKDIEVKEVNCVFSIISLVTLKTNEWEPSECPLCKSGSKPIKPKETEENWHLITTSQL